MGSHIRTSYTSNMFSLKLVICVCIFFVIGMEAAPKPKPKAKPKPQPKAEPKPYPPIGYPPYFGGHNLPDANPGPGNWNGFPPTRGANPWQLYWNGSPYPNRGFDYGVKAKDCKHHRDGTPCNNLCRTFSCTARGGAKCCNEKCENGDFWKYTECY